MSVKYFVYFGSNGNFITAAVNATSKVYIRCPSDWTDISDDEDLNVFIARHGGVDATAEYLLTQYTNKSKL